MSDYIRVELTPEEARLVEDAILYACGTSLNPVAADALYKIRQAKKNPLNGPTFPWAVAK